MKSDDYTLFAPRVFQQDKMLASGFHVNSQTLNLMSFCQKQLLAFLQVFFFSLYMLVIIITSSTFQNIEENVMIVIFGGGRNLINCFTIDIYYFHDCILSK